MAKFKRQFDKNYKGAPYQNDPGESVTKPSMTLTVRELMDRHTRGLDPGTQQKEEMYLPEGMEVPKVTDLTDLIYQREELKEKQKELNQKIKDERKAAKEREREARESKGTEVGSDSGEGLDNGQSDNSRDTANSKSD